MNVSIKKYIIPLISLLFFISCKENNQKPLKRLASSTARYVLFVHAGRESQPVLPILIYTNEMTHLIINIAKHLLMNKYTTMDFTYQRQSWKG